MSGIVSLADARERREPHMNGTARCLHCGHEHAARVPVGEVIGLECPACHLPKAVMVGLYEPADGAYRWACACGCQVFFVTAQDIQCLNCGQPTEAVCDT
jgi:hypothetical protein